MAGLHIFTKDYVMKNVKTKLKSILLASALLSTSFASAAVLDFEDFSGIDFVHGTVVNTQYSDVTISAENLSNGPDLAVVFDSGLSGTRDSDLEAFRNGRAGFGTLNSNLNGDFTPGNILIVQENNDGCGDGICNAPDDEGSRPGGIITFYFAEAITLESIDFFDVEGAETAKNAIQLFDEYGMELNANEFYTPNTGGDNLWDQVVFNVAGVSKVKVHFGGSGALDNLKYSVSAVPVPAAAFLFAPALLGFLGLRRKAKSNVA